MLSKSIAFAAVAASVAILGASGSAEAGKRHFGAHFGGHGHHHKFHHRHWRPHYYVYSGPSCGYYFKKWKWTGSSYWKHKYYDCIS